MGEIRVEQEIEATADQVWELVRDFGGIKKWNPGIDSCDVEGEGVGAIRTIKMGGVAVQERLEHIEEATRTFSYSIVSGPVPVENYLASMTIQDADGRAKVTWQSTFDPKGASEEDCANLFKGVYEGGIAGMREALG